MLLKTDIASLRITDAPAAGSLAQVVAMQADWYARHWGFGMPFESKVAMEAGEFGRALPHPDCRMWTARDAIGLAGSVTIDGRANPVARLRWFIVDERARGGLGRQLLDRALGFCCDRGFREVWLTTFDGLRAARRLYDEAGFVVEHEAPDTTWGVRVTEQVLRLRF